jgi:hypothetical protein
VDHQLGGLCGAGIDGFGDDGWNGGYVGGHVGLRLAEPTLQLIDERDLFLRKRERGQRDEYAGVAHCCGDELDCFEMDPGCVVF